ncbi:MAG: hypothetical protein H0V43_05925 [Gemmatimonadales bacterium]|nr:hypothetical protein [Gemmatimonadales bacterium]
MSSQPGQGGQGGRGRGGESEAGKARATIGQRMPLYKVGIAAVSRPYPNQPAIW